MTEVTDRFPCSDVPKVRIFLFDEVVGAEFNVCFELAQAPKLHSAECNVHLLKLLRSMLNLLHLDYFPFDLVSILRISLRLGNLRGNTGMIYSSCRFGNLTPHADFILGELFLIFLDSILTKLELVGIRTTQCSSIKGRTMRC